MTPVQLANLQRPWLPGKDQAAGRRLCAALLGALSAACAASEIEHASTTRRVMDQLAQDVHPPRVSWAGGFSAWPAQYTADGVPRAYTRPAVYRDEVLHHIAPGPFLAWLRAQGEEPSVHILAWCKSQGVTVGDAAPAADVLPLRLVEPAPVVQPAAAPPADQRKQEMLGDRARGMTDTAIGKKYDISRQRVGQVLGKNTGRQLKKAG